MLLRRWCADALILLMRWCCWCADAADALMLLMLWCCWCADAADAADALILLTLWCCQFLTVSCRFFLFLTVSHCFSLFLTVSHCFSWFLIIGLCVVSPVGLVGPWVWWACWSGGFCVVLTDKSPTLRGPTCQGVLGLVFHRFPGTSIRPHYMPVKWAECFPFRDFSICEDFLWTTDYVRTNSP